MKISTSQEIRSYPSLKALKPIKEKLCLSTIEGQTIISKHDISYLEADNNYCTVHYNDEKLLCSLTLKVLSSRLHFTNFSRVHRKFVVNIDKIKFINNAYSSLIMESGKCIPISRSQKQSLRNQMELHFD